MPRKSPFKIKLSADDRRELEARAPPALLALAGSVAALELATAWIPPYGLFHDELYYWAGAQRLGLGYVDHPPLAPWLLAASTAVLGDGRLAFRLLPALCFGATVLLAGALAQRFSAGRFGQTLAGLGVAVMPFSLILCSFYSVNALEILLWTATCFLLVELIRTGNERLWLGIGALAGIGLLNKHTFALLGAALALGVVATPLRAQLRSRWLWLGGAVALLLALPNLVWNAQHDWPSLAFYRSRPAVDLPATLGEAFTLQVLGANPASLLLWLPGFFFLLRSQRLRPYRPLALAFATLFVVILFSGQRRADRIASSYPVVLAAGASFWDQWHGRGYRGVRVALVGVLLAFGAAVLPAAVPLLPPPAVAKYFEALGDAPDIETSDVGQAIPLFLAGRLDWERFADEVAAAWETLPAAERERAVILAPHWVFASVLEYYGRDRGFPPVVAPHNAYWFWREEAAGSDRVLAVAIPAEVLSRYFTETRELGAFRCEYCTSFRPDLPIVLASGPVRPLEDLLGEWRHFSIEAAPRLRR
jgi:4-amino-4-deoxy-L-arabinose transferase-like glycosyltransferase